MAKCDFRVFWGGVLVGVLGGQDGGVAKKGAKDVRCIFALDLIW